MSQYIGAGSSIKKDLVPGQTHAAAKDVKHDFVKRNWGVPEAQSAGFPATTKFDRSSAKLTEVVAVLAAVKIQIGIGATQLISLNN